MGCTNTGSTDTPGITATPTEKPSPTPTPYSGPATLLPAEEEQVLDYELIDEMLVAYEKQRANLLQNIKNEGDMPVVCIMTEYKSEITSRDQYLAAQIDVINENSELELSAHAGVKVRGNSTANEAEKPYRIKFESKQSMLGLHDGNRYKSWVLMRTFWNFAPDYTAFKLADTIFQGEYYCSDAIYVKLYVNFEYVGIYMLCEQNQVAKDRFDVNEPKEGDYNPKTGYLIEMDNYANEEHPYFRVSTSSLNVTDINGVTRPLPSRNYSVKSDIYTEEQLAFISKYFEGVFMILYNASVENKALMFDENYELVSAEGVYTPYEAVAAVIDMKSFANMLILEELCADNDVGAGSFYFAIDFTDDSKYEKLTMCGPWDFNWAYNEKVTHKYAACTFQDKQSWGDNSSSWFILAMRMPEFQAYVKQRWSEVSSAALYSTLDDIEAYITPFQAFLGNDAWKVDSARGIWNFVRERIKWLDSKWK